MRARILLSCIISLLVVSGVCSARPVVPIGAVPPPSSSNSKGAKGHLASSTGNASGTHKGHRSAFKFTPQELWEVDGKMPPPIVLRFLENPTKENAERYLAWVQTRAKMMDRAIKVLEEIQEEKFRAKLNPAKINETAIVMYFSPTCPHCLRELRVVKRIKTDYPQVGLELIPVSDPYLAQVRLQEMGLGKFLVHVRKLPALSGVPYILLVDKRTGRIKKAFTGETAYETLLENM